MILEALPGQVPFTAQRDTAVITGQNWQHTEPGIQVQEEPGMCFTNT